MPSKIQKPVHKRKCPCCVKNKKKKSASSHRDATKNRTSHAVHRTEFIGKHANALMDFALHLETKKLSGLLLGKGTTSSSLDADSAGNSWNGAKSSPEVEEKHDVDERPFVPSATRVRADEIVEEALGGEGDDDYEDTLCAALETEWSGDAEDHGAASSSDSEGEFDEVVGRNGGVLQEVVEDDEGSV